MNTLRILITKYSVQLYGLFLFSILIPIQTFAQTQTNTTPSSSPACDTLLGGNIETIKDLIDWGTCIMVKSIVPILFVLALVVFIYGVIEYFLNPDSIQKRENARKYIIWALIGMFVIFTVPGIIEIIRNTFGISTNTIPLLPETQ